MFWSLAPFLLALLVAMLFAEWNIVTLGVQVFCVLMLLGLLDPCRFRWTWRGVGALVFVTYAAYLVDMLIESGGQATVGRSRAEPCVLNALTGLVAFGLPGLCYAIWGRFSFRKIQEAEDFEGLRESDDTES